VVSDMDDFKQINDGYGHLVGDEILHGVGKLIRSSIRDEDMAFRWGGDEFVIFFHTSETKLVESRMRKIEGHLASFRIRQHGSLPVHFSWGVTTTVGRPLRESVEEADRLMYEAKRTGAAEPPPASRTGILAGPTRAGVSPSGSWWRSPSSPAPRKPRRTWAARCGSRRSRRAPRHRRSAGVVLSGQRVPALLVARSSRVPAGVSTSQAQPEPNRPTAVSVNCFRNCSKDPKCRSMRSSNAPAGLPAAFGLRQFQ